MRSRFHLLAFIGCFSIAFLPKLTLCITAPYYVYREQPTSTPTYEPNLLRASNGKPSSFGFSLIIVGSILSFSAVGLLLLHKRRKRSVEPLPENEKDDSWSGWLSSFWQGDEVGR